MSQVSVIISLYIYAKTSFDKTNFYDFNLLTFYFVLFHNYMTSYHTKLHNNGFKGYTVSFDIRFIKVLPI
jgi:hypothetical protein